MSETVECRARNGTWVLSSRPNDRFWGSAKSWDWVGDAASKYRTFFIHNLPSDLRGKRVISATLRKRMTVHAGANRTLRLQRISAPPAGAFGPLTWNNQPAVLAGSTQYSVTQAPTIPWWEFDVTADLAAISAGSPFYGWRLTTTYTGGNWQGFGWSSDYPAELVVEFAENTTDPVGLEPTGLTALAKPVFTWDAPADILSAQIQIDVDGGNFSSPLFDSGDVATQIPQLDTNVLGYSGLTVGVPVNVRVRHTTAMGVSDWSDVVDLERITLGTLTITSPLSTTNDPTPTVGWTFTGTQTRYQVTTILNDKVIRDSGIVANTDTAHRPLGGATKSGDVLKYRLRVWDDVDRAPSPGDKGYAEQTVTSTYTPGAATAVTSLVVDQVGVAPWVDVIWTRVAIPDEWIVTRNGEIVARFDGLDGGGSAVLTYRDWTCPPNIDVAYRVFPVSGTTVGSTGPTATAHTVVDGAWVFDPETEEFFTFTGDRLDAAYGESSVIYDPTGSPVRVKRIWALRGLEGSVAGLLDDHDDHTAEDMYADFITIKGRPTRTVRLVLPDRNIPVILSNMTDIVNADSQTDRIRKDLSFEFFQDGENPFPEVAP